MIMIIIGIRMMMMIMIIIRWWRDIYYDDDTYPAPRAGGHRGCAEQQDQDLQIRVEIEKDLESGFKLIFSGFWTKIYQHYTLEP